MLRQTYPHDTWLADEDPSSETLRWCREHGVMISTRKNRADYHRPDWPRRTKCKEGNLAFFYDNYGYANYDFVVQLDADHVPTEGYLEEMLRGFADSKVGYVSAPSICDKNAEESWSARGRLLSRVFSMDHSKLATRVVLHPYALVRIMQFAQQRSRRSAVSALNSLRITRQPLS